MELLREQYMVKSSLSLFWVLCLFRQVLASNYASLLCHKLFSLSSFITPLAADNKIHTIHIKIEIKKSYKVTVLANTLHTASLTYTQLFVNKSIPYLQPIAMNLFWCSLDSAYSIGLFEQCILYQNINLRWSTRKDIGSVGLIQKNWRGLVLSNSTKRFAESSYSKQH